MGRIVIIHYHLNPGGVTRIIESQVQALRSGGGHHECLVLTGHCENREYYQKPGVHIEVKEELNYLTHETNITEIFGSLKDFLGQKLHAGDILHVHNLNLGKNPVLTWLIGELADRGFPVVNHAHDFAEDRPENYSFMEKVFSQLGEKNFEEIAYPEKSNFIHAVLNSSDRDRLLSYGVSRERVFLLPNPVVFEDNFDENKLPEVRREIMKQLDIPSEKKIITYPVRVIRRKNIGEYILLCWLFRDEAAWLVTQPPKNPVEINFYERWKQFCRDEEIPLIFEAGNRVDFEELLRASDFCFTTSTREGFGMVYMEPWLMNTAVIGRNLPIITRDLEQSGMQFPLLYNSFEVVHKGNRGDFSALSMEEQMNCIAEIKQSQEHEKELREYNPFLKNLLNSVGDSIVQQNKATILREFSLANYGQRLETIYQKLAG